MASNSITPELKDCPFCGGESEIRIVPDGIGHGESYDSVMAQCKTCLAKIENGSYKGHHHPRRVNEVACLWNRRA